MRASVRFLAVILLVLVFVMGCSSNPAPNPAPLERPVNVVAVESVPLPSETVVSEPLAPEQVSEPEATEVAVMVTIEKEQVSKSLVQASSTHPAVTYDGPTAEITPFRGLNIWSLWENRGRFTSWENYRGAFCSLNPDLIRECTSYDFRHLRADVTWIVPVAESEKEKAKELEKLAEVKESQQQTKLKLNSLTERISLLEKEIAEFQEEREENLKLLEKEIEGLETDTTSLESENETLEFRMIIFGILSIVALIVSLGGLIALAIRKR